MITVRDEQEQWLDCRARGSDPVVRRVRRCQSVLLTASSEGRGTQAFRCERHLGHPGAHLVQVTWE